MDEQAVLKHGGLGIASFTISVVVLVLVFALFMVGGIVKVAGLESPVINAIVGLSIMMLWLTDLFGIGLGIAGATQKKSKKVFPVLGIVIGTGTIAISVALVVIGIQMAARS